MMKVPDNVVPFAQPQATPQVDPKYLAMAAGLMHQEGRLFEPEGPITSSGKTPNQRVEEGHKDLSIPDLMKHQEFGDDRSYLNRRTGEYQFGKVT